MVTVRNAESAEAWRAKARRIESLGFDTITIPDHLTAQFAPIPALMAAADATTRLRVSALVFANDYRNPVLLAKEIATLDVLSQGRCDIGIGTGWYAPDYDMLGVPLDPAPVRVARLREAVTLLKRLLMEERVDFDGRFYRARGAVVLPRPVQRPHPPILIGAAGPTMLRLAAAHADVISITGPLGTRRDEVDTSWRAQKSEEAFVARHEIVRRAAGERFASCDVNIDTDIVITADREAKLSEIAAKESVSRDDVARSPHYFVGTVHEIQRQMIDRRERFGINYYRAPEADIEAVAPLIALLRTE